MSKNALTGGKATATINFYARKYGRELSPEMGMNIQRLRQAKSNFAIHICHNGVDIIVLNTIHPRTKHNMEERTKTGVVIYFRGEKCVFFDYSNWKDYAHMFIVRQELNLAGRSMNRNAKMRAQEMHKPHITRTQRGAYEEALQGRPSKRRCTGGGYTMTLIANESQNHMHIGRL